MKKLMLFCLFIGTLGVSFYTFSTKHTVKVKPIHIDFVPEIISISDLTQEMLSSFFKGEKPTLAVQCDEGKSLPCTIAVTGDMLMLNTAEISSTIKALKTFYVIFTKNNHWLFSKNLKDWYRYDEFFTIEKKLSLDIEKENPELKFELSLELTN